MAACPACGAWFVWPPPTAAAMVAHYDITTAGMPGELRRWREGTSQAKWYEVLAKKMARRARGDVKTIVDVGAGAMELTTSLARAFPHASVEAWDMFAGGIPSSLPDRVTAKRVDLNRLNEPATGSFDVVACVAVIEHVLDPLALLRFLHSITAPGGFVYVAGPEVTSIAHRVLRKAWPYYCPDEHLTIPSVTSIRRALSIVGDGLYELHRINVHYSLKYLTRFLHVPIPVPRFADFLLPIPAGAFELIWQPRRSADEGPEVSRNPGSLFGPHPGPLPQAGEGFI